MPDETAYVLGAGFSRAISDTMPLTDELGDQVLSHISGTLSRSGPLSPISDGTFEEWLSTLAEDQPYLSEAENLNSRADFLRIADALYEVLLNREARALRGSPPSWLMQFLSLIHADASPVITFNYDTLIEHAVMHHLLCDWDRRERANWSSIVEGPSFPSERHDDIPRSFSLLKLHGSLNWFWVPRDNSGATLNRSALNGHWGRPRPLDKRALKRALPGREPFVVPPAAVKSPYYRNPITRQLWSSARDGLAAADRVVLLGYSLPTMDFVACGLLRHSIKENATIHVVNKKPDPVRASLIRLGFDAQRIRTYAGPDCIRDYVDELVVPRSRTLPRSLLDANLSESLPILVSSAPWRGHVALRAERTAGRAIITVEQDRADATYLHRRLDSAPDPLTLGDLRAVIRRSEEGELAVRYPWNETTSPLISHQRLHAMTGYSNEWLALIPSGGPASSE